MLGDEELGIVYHADIFAWYCTLYAKLIVQARIAEPFFV